MRAAVPSGSIVTSAFSTLTETARLPVPITGSWTIKLCSSPSGRFPTVPSQGRAVPRDVASTRPPRRSRRRPDTLRARGSRRRGGVASPSRVIAAPPTRTRGGAPDIATLATRELDAARIKGGSETLRRAHRLEAFVFCLADRVARVRDATLDRRRPIPGGSPIPTSPIPSGPIPSGPARDCASRRGLEWHSCIFRVAPEPWGFRSKIPHRNPKPRAATLACRLVCQTSATPL